MLIDLHVYAADSGEGYTLDVHTAGSGKRYTLHVHSANGVDGYTMQVLTAVVGKGHIITSTQLTAERDTYSHVHIAGSRDTLHNARLHC